LDRLRSICTRHGILLIFDEVITGFGRTGAAFGAERFGVQPDMMTLAKGLTNAAVPMSAIAASDAVHDGLMVGPENMVELFHGYTYSGHPVACAAGQAALDIYLNDGLFERAAELESYWIDAAFSLSDHANVIDIRAMGLVGAIELEPIAGKPTVRAFDAFLKCFERGVLVRTTGDIIALSPPLIVEKSQIDQIFDTIGSVLKEAA
ncbi:MAG: aminotransferase class III-fold pyridoxal phosphate-dependent enzyme, partial [Rhodospirillaceae bacterium]|nr:aminotransferase class III-fold pyridoxal phosphate-dependent enzyme [Rhodospirillaceae bacterium]